MIDLTDSSEAGLEQRCVNTIRFLSADAVQKANSGHPGLPMGAAAIAHALFTRHLRFDPHDPAWPDRDRFVLSAGHGSMLLYSLLHLTGYDVSLDDLKAFRQWGSKTPGHPEYGHTPGVETTTGPLGQGISSAVGMALAERYLAAKFNGEGPSVQDHYTYVLAGDGDLMEGISAEAASFAGHQRLGKLVVLYDDNHITIDGETELAFTEDVCMRFRSYDWHVQTVSNGNDIDAIDAALTLAKSEAERPSLIAVRTHIGFGAPNRQDTSKAHGEPLGVEELALAKANLRYPGEPAFHVADDVKDFYEEAGHRGAVGHEAWRARHAAWSAAGRERAAAWEAAWSGTLPDGWDADLPAYDPEDGGLATRAASGQVINALAPHLPGLIGGSADLAPSNNTWVKDERAQQWHTPAGRNLHFGVREHAMAAIGNGMALHGGLRPYVATFFVFTDYMRPAMRLAALMGQPVIYVLTHDSIGLGEDGPTHQPVEHLAMLRATPGWTVIRPADANETVEAWKIALAKRDGPVALILTRQKLPTIDRVRYGAAGGLAQGAYVLADAGGETPDLILLASGSEVSLALDAHERLLVDGVRSRVVNLASWRLFQDADATYREWVLPSACHRRSGGRGGQARSVGSAGSVETATSSASTGLAPPLLRKSSLHSSASPPSTSMPAPMPCWRKERRFPMPPTDNRLAQLHVFGQSPWFDYISRELVGRGGLKAMVDKDGLGGVTSNPSIFEKAIGGGTGYDREIIDLAREGLDAAAIFDRLAIRRRARRLRRPRSRLHAQRRRGRLRLDRGLAAPRLRCRRDHRRSAPYLRCRRPAERDDQDPGHRRGRAGDLRVPRAMASTSTSRCSSRCRSTRPWRRPTERRSSTASSTTAPSARRRRWPASSSRASTRWSTHASTNSLPAPPTRRSGGDSTGSRVRPASPTPSSCTSAFAAT